jgi:branched-chain amino acid transport system ATP-binding protein
MTAALLEGRGLSVSYGGVKAVQDVDLELHAGEVVGLIGPNGAGKTSLMDGVTGFAPLTGTLTLRGADISGLRAFRRRRAGISRTWQSVGIFDDLTVAENVAMAATGARIADEVAETLARFGLGDVASRLPGELSHGQRVLVGVARASIGRPDLILMDEPAAGLGATERAELIALIRRTAAEGAAVLLVDHDMEVVFEACDRIYVLDFGRLIAQGTPTQIETDPAVIAAYLGTRQSGTDAARPAAEGASDA